MEGGRLVVKTTRIGLIPTLLADGLLAGGLITGGLLIGGLALVGCSGAVRDVQGAAAVGGGEPTTGVEDGSPAPTGPSTPSGPSTPPGPSAPPGPSTPSGPSIPPGPSTPSDPSTPPETEETGERFPPDTLGHEDPATNSVRIDGVRINGTVYCRDLSGNAHFRSAVSLSDCKDPRGQNQLSKTFRVSPDIGGFMITDLAVALRGSGLTTVDVLSPFSRSIGAGTNRRGGWTEITVIGPGGLYDRVCSSERTTYRLRYGIDYYEAEYFPLPAPEGESDQDRTDREMKNTQRETQRDWLRVYFSLTEEEIANSETSTDTTVVDSVSYFNGLDDDAKRFVRVYFSLPEEERSYAVGACRFTYSHGDPPYEMTFVPYSVTAREVGSRRDRGARLSLEIITSSGGIQNVPPHDPYG